MTEREWQRTVMGLASLYSWRAHHFRPAMTGKGWRTPVEGSGGFPDLVLVRDRVLFRELKTEKTKPTVEQLACLADLARAGADVAIWRPADLGLVIETLSARTTAEDMTRAFKARYPNGPLSRPATTTSRRNT